MTGGIDGGVTLAIAGAPLRLAFDWSALASLRSMWGEDFQERMNAALTSYDFEKLSFLVEMASGRKLSAFEVMRASPPIVPTIVALSNAIRVAYHGPEALREAAEEKGEEGPLAIAAGMMMRRLKSLAISFWRRWKRS